jgi:hypothetical protein
MAITIDHLAAYLRQYFAEKLPVGGDGGPGTVILVFDALGQPMPASEFMGSHATGVQDVLAHQRAAELADQLPAYNTLASGSYLARAGSKLSRLYESMIKGAVPAGTDPATLASFEAGKANALASLENSKLAIVSGTVAGGSTGTVPASGTLDHVFATGMSPVDWYGPGATSWQTYQLDAANAPPPPVTRTPWGPYVGTPPPDPAGAVVITDFSYQVAPDELLVLMVEQNPDGPSPCPVEIDQLDMTAEELLRNGAIVADPAGLDVAVHEGRGAPDGARPLGRARRTDRFVRDLGITAITGRRGTELDALAARAGVDVAELRAQPIEEVLTNDVLLRRLLPDDALAEVARLDDGPEVDRLADMVRAHAVLADAADPNLAPLPDWMDEVPSQNWMDDMTAPQVVAAATESVPSGAGAMHVSFQYCMVRFDRPWWDELFVGRRGWVVPGYQTGEISSGTITKATGHITLLTIGMLVVRKLEIRATWTDADRAALSRAVSLGPFSLAGSAFDAASGQILNEGMQAVGWLCQVPPVLPP